MDSFDAVILGIIQGFTEFLPVSSSGHLELGKAILGDNSIPEDSLLFTVVLHFATALSTMVIFRKDIVEIVSGLFKFKWNSETRFSVKIIISMFPAVLIGLLFETQLEAFFDSNININSIDNKWLEWRDIPDPWGRRKQLIMSIGGANGKDAWNIMQNSYVLKSMLSDNNGVRPILDGIDIDIT